MSDSVITGESPKREVEATGSSSCLIQAQLAVTLKG